MYQHTPPLFMRPWMLALALTAAMGLQASVFSSPAWALEPTFQANGLAISGYDPVAYFTEKRPVPGKAEFETQWKGATWRFASKENRQRFLKNPKSYAPQYGGYCAYAVSKNSTASTDPQAWTVDNNKLYLNYNVLVRTIWQRKQAENIKKGNIFWPQLLKQ